MIESMRYRIKITTFDNGKKEYLPQVKAIIGWKNISIIGKDYRYQALDSIGSHYQYNVMKQTIEFEYINK